MAVFEYSLPAVCGLQAGREYFVAMCPLELIPRLFPLDEDSIRPELRAQRILNKARIPEISRYISEHPNSYVLSSLTASIDARVQFEPLSGRNGRAGFGYLKMPLAGRLLLHDGLHRRAAIAAALKDKPELGSETVSLVLFVDPQLRRAEQLFTDLKRNETRSARSQGILYDHRDELARIAKALVGRVEVFQESTEMLRSKLSNRSLKLFTLSGIYHAVRILLADKQEMAFSAKLELSIEFWSEVATHMPDWQRVRTGDVSPAQLRKDFVHAHAIALAALARAGKALIASSPSFWKRKLRALKTLDWSRANTVLWEGRAMIGGRLSKATTCVVLTGNAIKTHLGLPLSAQEQAIEDHLKGRALPDGAKHP